MLVCIRPFACAYRSTPHQSLTVVIPTAAISDPDGGAPVARPGQALVLVAARLVRVAGLPLPLDVLAEPGDVAHPLDLSDAQHRVRGCRYPLPSGRPSRGNVRFRNPPAPAGGRQRPSAGERNIEGCPTPDQMWNESTLLTQYLPRPQPSPPV